MKKFRGVFAENKNWITNIIYVLFNQVVTWLLFKLPYSKLGAKIMIWFVQHDPEEYSGS